MPKLNKDQLADIIRGEIQDQMKGVTDVLQTQTTDWMESLRSKGTRGYSKHDDDRDLGIGAARFVRALAAGKGNPDAAIAFAQKAWSDDLGDRVQKDLAAGDLTAGGFMVPPEFSSEIIELLRNSTVVRKSGPLLLPLNNGTLTLPRQSSASTATYVGELNNISVTEPAGDQLQMTAKKLGAIVPISNDLLRFAPGNTADEFVRNDLVMQIAIREDAAFLRDDGLSDKPKGLRFWAQAANIQASNGTSATNIEDDLKELINDLEINNVRMIRPVWMMNPRSKNHLRNLRDANGNLIFPETRLPSPVIYGWPVMVSTNVPINLGSGGNESEIYLVDMADAIIAESDTLEISVDGSASFTSGGVQVSSFERDETLVRAIARHDFAVRHPESVAVTTAVTWGA